jgi:hypothetical protein
MRTEISAKFTCERLETDLLAAGLELVRWFTDPDELFALTLSRLARPADRIARAGEPAGARAGERATARAGERATARAGERATARAGQSTSS